ncbi:chemotaxis protein CheW [Microvirga solisilvae]|uniref:chemotaxis protein CheW n=1 Tax=Microvirga solisilvae TaxID=2919498 RepID=UPI001FAEA87B
MTEAAVSDVAESFLTIEVGGERFALPASQVAEVIRPPAVTRVPLGPASLLGVANLRGAVMPVVSLQNLLGRQQTPSATSRVVVIDRGAPVGLVIDRVTSLGTSVSDTQSDSGQMRALDLDALLAKAFGSLTRRAQGRQVAAPRIAREEVTEQDKVALVCFEVASQDFALPLASVHEVVALSENFMIVPQTENVMLGVMSLRSVMLPLISLRALLGLRAASRDGGRARVVVARIGEQLVGLAVDAMKEILRIPSTMIGPVPAILTRGNAETQIQGICQLEGGQRLVSVLSTDHLFRDQALIEQISSRTETSEDMGATDLSSHGDEQFIVFQLGGEEYGLPIEAVDEVIRVPDTLTRVPKAPVFIEGVMNLRGRVVPVIDQRQRFKVEGQGERRRERIVVVRIDHLQAGFIVDAVSEVLKIPQDQLRPTPDLAAEGSQVIDRIANIEVEGRMILLINPRDLLDRAEKDLLAAMSENQPERPSS